jgi:hypothetical protein
MHSNSCVRQLTASDTAHLLETRQSLHGIACPVGGLRHREKKIPNSGAFDHASRSLRATRRRTGHGAASSSAAIINRLLDHHSQKKHERSFSRELRLVPIDSKCPTLRRTYAKPSCFFSWRISGTGDRTRLSNENYSRDALRNDWTSSIARDFLYETNSESWASLSKTAIRRSQFFAECCATQLSATYP